MVTELSALRLATNAHGVTQVVGTSSPVTIASAPEGVDATLIVSVVPRATDAQPPRKAHAAKQAKIRMNCKPPQNPESLKLNQRESSRAIDFAIAVIRCVCADTVRLCSREHLWRSLFAPRTRRDVVPARLRSAGPVCCSRASTKNLRSSAAAIAPWSGALARSRARAMRAPA